jgi:hypothetical protein
MSGCGVLKIGRDATTVAKTLKIASILFKKFKIFNYLGGFGVLGRSDELV